MQPSRLSILILLLLALQLPAAAESRDPLMGASAEALPPPPGPYVSSRPQLAQSQIQGGNTRVPFIGTMPSPMGYMPYPGQFSAPPPPRWWGGPAGR